MVSERYRFTNTGNSVMKVVGVLGIALAGFSVIGAVTAYGQIDTRSQYGGATAAVVDDKGNLRVPADYPTTYDDACTLRANSNALGSQQGIGG